MGVVSTIGVLIAAAAVGGIAVLYGVEEQTMRRFLDDGEGNDDDDPLAGCTIEPVGCFTVRASGLRDPLSVTPLGRAVQPVCPAVPKPVAAVPAQDGCDGAECRSLQYGVAGCSGPGTTPAPTPSPQCDQPQLTNELCGQYCFEWLSELSDEIWAGTNNGECYCDTEYDPGGDSNGQCDAECPESDTGCDQPCAGAPTEMCGGAWFNMVVKVSCGGWPWAWPFVYGFCGVCVGYMVIGTALNMSMGKNEMPNAGFWRSVGGLVNDGMAYTMGHQSDASASYKPIPASAAFVPQQVIAPQQPPQAAVLAGTPYVVQPTAVAAASGERKKKKKVRSSSRDDEGGGEGKVRRKKKDSEGEKEKKMRKKKKPENPGPVAGME